MTATTTLPRVWLRLARKTAGLQSVTQDEALDIALAYGWIDAKGKSESDTHWLLKFTPRRKRSLWSKRNREKALALIAVGDMKPSGLAEVERARQDGLQRLADRHRSMQTRNQTPC